MAEYAAAITFDDTSRTYEAYSRLSRASGLGIEASGIVERDQNGHLRVPERDDANFGVGTAGGSLLGILVGVLGGPVGLLLGWGVGTAAGALVDATRLDIGDDAISEFGRLVPPGSNAILAQTSEEDTGPLDAFVHDLGGQIIRRPLDEVLGELEAQQQAAEDAAEAARKRLREQKSAERREKWEDRVESLRSRFVRDAGASAEKS